MGLNQGELDELRKGLQPFDAAVKAARNAVGSLKERADELTKELEGGMTRLGTIEGETTKQGWCAAVSSSWRPKPVGPAS